MERFKIYFTDKIHEKQNTKKHKITVCLHVFTKFNK